MEMKITKTVTVEFDNSLGYPIAFVKASLLSNEGAARAVGEGYQSAMLRYIEDLDAGRIDLEYLENVIKEYVLLCWRLLHGYLYYPAYNSYVGRAPYNCGPKFIGSVGESLDKYDRKVGSEFNALCDKLTDQIADYVLSTIKEGKDKKAVEEPVENPEPKNPLRAAVEKLNRKDVIFEDEDAYLVLTQDERDYILFSIAALSYANVFLASTFGWNDSQIWHRFTMPLMDGKVLLPMESAGPNFTYRASLKIAVKSEATNLKIKDVQEALRKILHEHLEADSVSTSEPMYFQVAQKPTSPFLDSMRFLLWNHVKGFNMAAVDEIIINPMAEGRIYLINDLPAAAKTVGRDYCEALKCWLNPLVWRKFIAKLNEIHPDVKT